MVEISNRFQGLCPQTPAGRPPTEICLKDLPRITVLHNKAFNVAKNPKYDGYQHDLASMVYKYFDKKSSCGAIKSQSMPNKHPLDLATQQLAEALHMPIIRKSEWCNW